jgi:hypothetical protein
MRGELAVFSLVLALAALVLGLLCLTGCAGTGITQAHPTSGGKLTIDRQLPMPTAPTTQAMAVSPTSSPHESLQFIQGDNANTPSSVETTPDGRLKVVFGTVEKPVLVVPPAPDYTAYCCLAAGIGFIGGGIALACYGWPQIGWRLALAGGAMAVLALTVKSYGWAYVVAVAVAAGYIIWEKYHGYTLGLAQGALSSKPA